jgi:solute carrier family 25 S-adenosylmethionine transporter 26
MSNITGTTVTSPQAAICGFVAGGVAAALTTPLDVIKTRIMLSSGDRSIIRMAAAIWNEKGVRGFGAGIVPRVMWISIGGSIFLGVYDLARKTIRAFSE